MPKKFLYALVLSTWMPLLMVLGYHHSSPLGDTIKFRHDLRTDQEWAERMVKNGQGPVALKSKFSSFLLKTPENYHSLTIRTKFKNKAYEAFKIGVQTNLGTMKRNIRSLDYKPLNDFPWPSIQEDHTTLFQKFNTYETLEEFYHHPPSGAIITFYEFSDWDKIKRRPTVLADYEPNEEGQDIKHALRGSHLLYTYIKNEDLYFELEKQDINRVEGEDVLTIDIANAASLFTQTVPDDGISDASGRVENIQIIKIHLSDLTEGVYKITLNQPGGDALIKNIKTRQQKLVFANKIYPADSQLYDGVLPQSVTLYSQGGGLKAMTREEFSTQTLIVDDQLTLALDEADQVYSLTLPLGWHQIFIPQSNVQLSDNFFAFSPEAYFEPLTPSFYPYHSKMEEDSFDYLLTSYLPPREENGWLVSHQVFDTSRIERPDNLVSITLMAFKKHQAKADGEPISVAYLDIEMNRPAPENPQLAQKLMGFFPKLINTVRAVEPDKRVGWLRDQFSQRKILSSLFSRQAEAKIGTSD